MDGETSSGGEPREIPYIPSSIWSNYAGLMIDGWSGYLRITHQGSSCSITSLAFEFYQITQE